MNHILLYGPPGSGKSCVGEALAERLHLPFIDLDLEIENAAGRSISQIMDERGETVFRDLETEALKRVLKEGPSIVALGGGALLRTENRRFAEENGQIVFLEVKVSALVERLRKEADRRPLLTGNMEEKLRVLLEQRREHYASFAVRVSQSGKFMRDLQKTPGQIASEIQQRLDLLRVPTAARDFYDVIVLPGGLDSLGSRMRERGLGNPVAVIADETVADLYAVRTAQSLHAAGYQAHVITFPAGESSKNIETVMKLWQGMLQAGLDRTSTVVALGGGVTGDLAGFAAATFMRGIDWVGVPTTLLAMVDSCLGGKTGFDLPQGKNLAGSFHDPRLVVVDSNLIATLTARQISAGMAEVVKHGIIGDPELLQMTARGLDFCKENMLEIMRGAITVKMDIIARDAREQNLRAALNLGHTIGHAVEAACGYRLLHGEAIAIGLVAETLLAEALGIAEGGLAKMLARIMRGLDLPVWIPDEISRQKIIDAMHVDKKKANGIVRFTLPVRVGEVKAGVEIEDLETALDLISQGWKAKIASDTGRAQANNRKHGVEVR